MKLFVRCPNCDSSPFEEVNPSQYESYYFCPICGFIVTKIMVDMYKMQQVWLHFNPSYRDSLIKRYHSWLGCMIE